MGFATFVTLFITRVQLGLFLRSIT